MGVEEVGAQDALAQRISIRELFLCKAGEPSGHSQVQVRLGFANRWVIADIVDPLDFKSGSNRLLNSLVGCLRSKVCPVAADFTDEGPRQELLALARRLRQVN